MLYDPRWEKPSVAGFKAWLERQDPDATFVYSDCDRCAVGQYLISIGTCWRQTGFDSVNELNMFACRAACGTHTPTFGAVLREIEFAEAA
jgi:hypothetical protein